MNLHPAVAILVAPLLPGIIQRTKALFAGRRGQPLLQPYHDLFKLIRKGAVYSRTTTWVFRAGPLVSLACMITVLFLMPFGGRPAPLSFEGDLLLFAALLGLARFFTVTAALDTGSSFEGMGASREVQFSALTEPALFLSLAALALKTGSLSLSGMLFPAGAGPSPVTLLVSASLLVVFLAENARIPFDDPDTHLELTMVHEVMILDHSGPDLAFLLHAAALKLWLLGAVLVGLLLSPGGFAQIAGMAGLAVLTGVIESSMARLRLKRVPQLLAGASALAVFALLLVLR